MCFYMVSEIKKKYHTLSRFRKVSAKLWAEGYLGFFERQHFLPRRNISLLSGGFSWVSDVSTNLAVSILGQGRFVLARLSLYLTRRDRFVIGGDFSYYDAASYLYLTSQGISFLIIIVLRPRNLAASMDSRQRELTSRSVWSIFGQLERCTVLYSAVLLNKGTYRQWWG